MIGKAGFKSIIWKYYKENGRDMPWRKTRDPYRILISEIMLQQTQVTRVREYYARFIKKFPDFTALAHAKREDVLRLWQGLGYNRRALFLLNTAKIIVKDFNGRLPRKREELESLPGIGKATAGALRAFAFNEPEIFIETNIRRVFIHFFFPNNGKVTDQKIERCIKETLGSKNPRLWYYALMDYGASLGAARTVINPNRRSAHYNKQSRFKGSDREVRGEILRLLLSNKKLSESLLINKLNKPKSRVRKIVASLESDGFIERNGPFLKVNGG